MRRRPRYAVASGGAPVEPPTATDTDAPKATAVAARAAEATAPAVGAAGGHRHQRLTAATGMRRTATARRRTGTAGPSPITLNLGTPRSASRPRPTPPAAPTAARSWSATAAATSASTAGAPAAAADATRPRSTQSPAVGRALSFPSVRYHGPGRRGMAIATTPTFRTDAFIDGAFRPAQTGDRFATENPATGQQLTDIAAGDAPDIDLAVASARRGLRRRPLVAPLPRRAQGRPAPPGRPDRGERRGAGDARLARGGQADHRLSRDGPAGDDQDVPLVRGGGRQAVRLDRADGAGCAGDDHPRADRGRRCRPAVELPDHDGGLEGGPVARRRQQPGHQAGRAHLAQHDPARRAGRRRRASPTASSTSSRVSARRPARRSGGTWTSMSCRSPARPRSGACSSATRRRATSSGSSSSAAARARRS